MAHKLCTSICSSTSSRRLQDRFIGMPCSILGYRHVKLMLMFTFKSKVWFKSFKLASSKTEWCINKFTRAEVKLLTKGRRHSSLRWFNLIRIQQDSRLSILVPLLIYHLSTLDSREKLVCVWHSAKAAFCSRYILLNFWNFVYFQLWYTSL